MSKFIDYPELFIEDTELNRMINLIDSSGYRNILVQMTETFGIFKRVRDGSFTSLQVYNSSSGKIGIYSGLAFGSDGNFINVPANLPDLFSVPSDGIYRRVFIQYAQTQVETGTIAVTTGGTITGTGTVFTQLFKPGKNIEIINSLLGNNGVYGITAVSSDTSMTAASFPANESGLSFKFQGVYTPSVSIPDGNKRPYWYDSYNITLQADTVTETDTMFCLGRVVNNAGVITITDVRDKIHQFKQSYIPEFSGAYTLATTFKVGATTGGSGGRYVQLIPNAPPPPLNIFVTDIYPQNQINNPSNLVTLGVDVARGIVSPNASIALNWNFTSIVGTGGINIFTVTGGNTYSFTTNQLIGYQLYLPAPLNLSYLITANTSGTTPILTVENLDQTAVDLTGHNSTNLNPAIIHSGADRYEIVAYPLDASNNPIYSEITTFNSTFNNGVVQNSGVINLQLGRIYNILMYSYLNGVKSTSYTSMGSGSFIKYGQTYSYLGGAFLVGYPVIPTAYDNGVIGFSSTPNGFELNITGWDNADIVNYVYFEVCYTTDTAGADFSNHSGNNTIFRIADRKIDITTSSNNMYDIKVRPVIGGQVNSSVSPFYKETKGVSGSGGNLPQDQTVGDLYIKHLTYSGTFTTTTIGGKYVATVSTVVSPALGTNSITGIYGLVGEIFNDGTNDFIIGNFISASGNNFYITPTPLNGSAIPASSGSFTIGVSKYARLVYYKNNITIPYLLTRIAIDCDIIDGGNVTIRAYQPGNESGAGYAIVTGVGYAVQDIGVKMSTNYGALALAIDLWDSSGSPINTSSFVGQVSVFGIPQS